jgi:hypothetical protein
MEAFSEKTSQGEYESFGDGHRLEWSKQNFIFENDPLFEKITRLGLAHSLFPIARKYI